MKNIKLKKYLKKENYINKKFVNNRFIFFVDFFLYYDFLYENFSVYFLLVGGYGILYVCCMLL